MPTILAGLRFRYVEISFTYCIKFDADRKTMLIRRIVSLVLITLIILSIETIAFRKRSGIKFYTPTILKILSDDKETIKPNSGSKRERGQFLFMYTCKICTGRNANMVSKLAYYHGTVIATCTTCKTRHLLADNEGKLDMKSFGQRADQYLSEQGQDIQRFQVTEHDLETNHLVDNDGKLSLRPKNSSHVSLY